MASPFQQQSLYRKFIYFGLIVALFTGSLILRRVDIRLGPLEYDSLQTRAHRLQLSESDRGQVELTDSALRLTLGGLRGLAITSLWLGAIEKQRKHEWSELEVLVRSLTKLQPHYISPWLFQSWNLAFNVSVECDRSRDKYFYISRGIELLAQGERKNEGNKDPDPERRTPGHPEMRYFIGFTYQLKVAQGDEKRTLRCLFDLSCIPPNRRDAAALWGGEAEGREAYLRKLQNFRNFCADNPRLVRRLREQLGFETPRQIVDFLAENREVPTRFQKPDAGGNAKLIEEETERCPVLPPGQDLDSNDSGDVFAVTRAWYEYAQEPLPTTTGTVGDEPPAVPGRSRLPRMAQYIFRSYPARAQAYVGEELEAEGWFDADGWRVTGWFDELRDGPEHEVLVGKLDRFDARRAWRKAHAMYVDYGRKNALWPDYPPFREDRQKLVEQKRQEGPGGDAAVNLLWIDSYVRMTNFDTFLQQTDAEKYPETAAARKRLYEADRKRKEDDTKALALYRAGLEDWVDVVLRFPEFGQQSHIQEDTYETVLTYLRLLQEQRKPQLEPLFKQVAQAAWPPGFIDEALTYTRGKSKRKIVPTRNSRGPLELYFVYAGPPAGAETVKAVTLGLAQAALWPPAPLRQLIESDPSGKLQRRLLLAERLREAPPGPTWRPLLDDYTINLTRERRGLNPPATPQNQPAPGLADPAAPKR